MNIPNGDGQVAAPAAVVEEPTPGTPEYDAAMAAKGSTVDIKAMSMDGKTVTTVNTPVEPAVPTEPAADPAKPADPDKPAERPAWLPEAFKSEAEFKEWYGTTDKGKAAAPAVDPAKPPEEAATPATQKFFDEYAKTGSISQESYAELA